MKAWVLIIILVNPYGGGDVGQVKFTEKKNCDSAAAQINSLNIDPKRNFVRGICAKRRTR